ncbi:MAG: hypothetical protein WCK96_04690 [Methylococcales bacterium]
MKYIIQNRLVKALVVILLLTVHNTVIAQPEQNFDELLAAYAKIKDKYQAATLMPTYSYGQNQVLENLEEEVYWREQYSFYKSKILKILNDYDQAARKDPRTFCLKALQMYSQYNNVGGGFIYFPGETDITEGLTPRERESAPDMQLSRYCSRFDIYYDISSERM